VVILCALAGDPEVADAIALRPLPIVAFDGVQGAELDGTHPLRLALPVTPSTELAVCELMAGVGQASRAAQLILAGLRGGAGDRRSLLNALRSLGPFDDHGDPVNPPVWLWRADADWRLSPERPLAKVR
jgi:hypothetical protein